MNITNIETKPDKNSKDYLVVTADGNKIGCFDDKLFGAIKTAYANGTAIELQTKVSGKYTTIIGIGGQGATHRPPSPSSNPSPAIPPFNGQENGMIINNACDLVGRKMMPGEKLPTQEDILAMAITIWKANNAFKLKISEKPVQPPIEEEQDEVKF